MNCTRINNSNSTGVKPAFMAEGKPLSVPNSPGVWVYTLTGSKVKVSMRAGILYFPAGEWAEDATLVSKVAEKHEKTPLLRREGFVKVHRIIDVTAA